MCFQDISRNGCGTKQGCHIRFAHSCWAREDNDQWPIVLLLLLLLIFTWLFLLPLS
jgi:hypothetical protein